MKFWENIINLFLGAFVVGVLLYSSNVYAAELDNTNLITDTSSSEIVDEDFALEEDSLSQEIEANLDITEEINSKDVLVEDILKEEFNNDTNNKLESDTDNIEADENIEVTNKKEDIFNAYSTNISFDKDIAIIKGNISEAITVREVLANINISEIEKIYLLDKVGITNEEDGWLSEEDYVTNLCHIVFIGDDFVSRYSVSFLGDLNQDNLINDLDIDVGINDYLNNNLDTDDKVSYIDYIIDNNNYTFDNTIISDVLSVNLENISGEDKLVGDEVSIKLKIDGFVNNYINTISGNLVYDNNILNLKHIYVLVDGKVTGYSLDDKFIYVLDNYNLNEALMIITFNTIGYGVSDIYLDNLNLLMNGNYLSILNDNKITVTVNEYGWGGDVELDSNNDNLGEEVAKDPATNVNSNPSNNPIKVSPTVNNNKDEAVVLSHDNYIKSLVIVGHDINFDKEVTNYSVNVDNNTDALTLGITLNNEKASYFITGDEDFVVGKNEIILTILAEDGSSRDYVIEVNKDGPFIVNTDIENEDNTNNVLEFVVLIILIITIILLIYRLLKKDY